MTNSDVFYIFARSLIITMNRFRLIVLLSVFVICSCSVLQTTDYMLEEAYALSEVEVNNDVMQPTALNSYGDSKVSFVAEMTNRYFNIEIKNLTDSAIKVIWDEASFIDQAGVAHRVIHTGTKYVDKEKAQVPSSIPKHSRISETLAPADHIAYYGSSGWSYSPLYTTNAIYGTKEELQRIISDNKVFKLMIPIEIGDIIDEYTFSFGLFQPQYKEFKRLSGWGIVAVSVPCLGAATALMLLSDKRQR